MKLRALLVLLAVAASVVVPAAAAPTAAGARLVAQQVHFRRDRIGGLAFYGELVNRGPGTAANVGVQVSLYGKGGQRVARGVTLRVSRNVLRRGEKAVWVAQMSDNPKSWRRVKVEAAELVGREDAIAQDYRAVRSAAVRISPENPGFSQKVTGRIANVGPKTTKVSSVTVALYGPGGRLDYVTDNGLLYPWPPTQTIRRGRTAPFKASILETRKAARIVVYVRASTKGANGFYLS